MRRRAVFLDSGIFIALLSRRDHFHVQAKSLFSGDRPRWSSSVLVLSECYSWFLHRHGEEAARTFRRLISDLAGLEVHAATREHHEEVCAMLDRLRGARLTYVDASSLVLLERQRIDEVWSTDHHLGLTGARILPRS